MTDHPIYVIGLIHFYLFKKTSPAMLLVFPASLSLSLFFPPNHQIIILLHTYSKENKISLFTTCILLTMLYLSVHVCMLSHFSHIRLFATPWTVTCQTSLSLRLPSKNTGVGCHALLQETFLTQGSNSCLLYLLLCRWILCHWATEETPLFYYAFNYKASQKCSH